MRAIITMLTNGFVCHLILLPAIHHSAESTVEANRNFEVYHIVVQLVHLCMTEFIQHCHRGGLNIMPCLVK